MERRRERYVEEHGPDRRRMMELKAETGVQELDRETTW